MEYNMTRESLVAQEQRHDLLRQVERERLIRLAKAVRASGVQAVRLARVGSRVRMMWRKAAT